MKHLKYAKYLFWHKWFVFVECCKLGIPFLGIIHDLSKFKPSEWFPYVNFFYSGAPSTKTGATLAKRSTPNFDAAWNHHQKYNKHHWQFWLLVTDDGGVDFNSGKFKVLPMPHKYRREMLADWIGAGKALGKPDTRAWYIKNYDNIILHPETREWVNRQLHVAPFTIEVNGIEQVLSVSQRVSCCDEDCSACSCGNYDPINTCEK